jgi:hypothetical protein
VQRVILPRAVAPEVHEFPAELKKGLEIVYVDTYLDVLPYVLEGIEERTCDEQGGVGGTAAEGQGGEQEGTEKA